MKLFKAQILCVTLLGVLMHAQQENMVIDGLAAIVDDHIILKSDVAQLVQMTAVQQRINPQLEPKRLLKLQADVLQSMIDQKIILEMAKIDSIEIKEKEVEQALDQQIEYMVSQAGGEDRAEEMLGQSLKSLRREYRQDMHDRMITERYQQQLLSSMTAGRQEVITFFNTFRDSLPVFPTKINLWHILIPIEAGEKSQNSAFTKINELRDKIIGGESFEELAKQCSQDPGSAPNGGNLGFVRRGSLVLEFESVAFTLPINEISQPVKTSFGYHLIQPVEKQGEKINVRHILITPEITEVDDSEAYQFVATIKDSITSLATFIKMAKTHSTDDETKGLGGDLGWIDPKEFPIPEVAKIINYLEINQCSPPVKTSYGYHLFWIEDTKRGGRADINIHWADLEMMATEYKKTQWYANWIDKARENFYIRIME